MLPRLLVLKLFILVFLTPHGKLVKLLLHWQYKEFWRGSNSETFPNIFRCASNVKWFC